LGSVCAIVPSQLFFNMALTALFTLGLLSLAQALPASYRFSVLKRGIEDIDTEYDYVVVGGGTAGSTVADRLSEDGKKSVLLVEYGRLAFDKTFMPPFSIPSTEFLYNLSSVPQPHANNRVFPVPNGAVVGGGSAVNGQIFFRGSKEDHDNWAALGNEGWDWKSVYPHYKKSHSFNPPTPEMKKFGMTSDPSAYGHTTPIYATLPAFQYPGQKIQWKAWSERDGIVPQKEHANGNAYGMIWVPLAMDPKTHYNRSFAAVGHYTRVQPRPNYHLLTLHRALKVNFKKEADGRQKAVSVSIQARYGNKASFKVKARKEIVLSASATRTPILLQLSGIGPKKVIEDAGIKCLIDLPGVGYNLQDHSHTLTMYNFTKDVWPTPGTINTNATFKAEALAEFEAKNSGPFTAPTIASALLLPARSFTGDHQEALVAEIAGQDDSKFLPEGLDATLLAGYAKQKEVLLASFKSKKSAIFEHPFQGSARGTAILLKPFSRGFVHINPADPLGDPIFDYRLLSNPIDLKIHVRMQQYLRNHFATSKTLAPLRPVELTPGRDRMSDEEMVKWLVDENNLNASNGHSVGTAAMSPKEHGGVVDKNLKVYGTRGLSIADTSVIPLIVGAHTMSTAYMIGEKAATLIKARNA
jgi:choline dehydrogenase-like flavoprotein